MTKAGNVLSVLTVIIMSVINAPAAEMKEEYPFLDAGLGMEERVHDLINRMTLEEKVTQMRNTSPEIQRLGVPAFEWWNECLHGCVGRQNVATGVATVFPQAIGLASTWNPELIYKVASVISDEVRAKNIEGETDLTCWSPNINMARDPRWGRIQESYGEDPYLTSRIAVAFCRGLQGEDPKYIKVVATPKHFALNNEEWRRHSGSAKVSQRILREYYLPQFKACITEAKACSIMGAYNAINGVPCNCNTLLLKDILRDEWGFKGYVVSDCWAIKDIYESHKYTSTPEEAVTLAVKAGCDLNCGSYYEKYLYSNVEKGLVTEDLIDRSVKRLFMARFRLGLFDPPEMVPYSNLPYATVCSRENRELARKAACESIILLKNENNLLPLKRDIKSIAVIGPNANVCQLGNYSGMSERKITPLQGIKKKVSRGTKVYYSEGCKIGESFNTISSKYFVTGGPKKECGLKASYYENPVFGGEPVKETVDPEIDFTWMSQSPLGQVGDGKYSVRWTGKLIPPETRVYQLRMTNDDLARLYLDGQLLLESWYDTSCFIAKKRILYKEIKLEANREYDVIIEYIKKRNVPGVVELAWNYNPDADRGIEKAAKLAAKSDIAIVVVGTDLTTSEEENDRSILGLVGKQEDLVQSVYAANPNTVLLLVNGEPLSVNRASQILPAIVEAWYPGEEGGNAIADVLFGNYNPAGRLPLTVYVSVDQLPDFEDYDILKGRTYMYFDGKVLYPFGYGLSYTQFEYSNLVTGIDKDKISVKLEVKNTGKVTGDEVVQLYVRDVVSSVKRPIKELKGFKRINLKPVEKKEVEFAIQTEALSYFDEAKNKFIIEPGQFIIMAGSSSQDIRLSGSIEVK